MTRAIICGGRDRSEAIWIFAELDKLHEKRRFTLIVEGGQRSYETERGKKTCVGGADYWANRWALSRCVETVTVAARWAELGDRAGPIRNQAMLDEFKPIELVVAFPGGAGTADMVRKAHAAGIEVVEIRR